MAEKPPTPEKFSLYKPVTPLSRDELKQHKPEKKTITSNDRDYPSSPSSFKHQAILKEKNVPIEVHVVRHTPREEKKRAPRFSSNFMPFDISTSFDTPTPIPVSSMTPPPPVTSATPPTPPPASSSSSPPPLQHSVTGEPGERREEQRKNETSPHPSSISHDVSTEVSTSSFTSKKPTQTLSSNTSSQSQKKRSHKPKGKVIPSRYMSSTKPTSSAASSSSTTTASSSSTTLQTSATGSTTSLSKSHTTFRRAPSTVQKPVKKAVSTRRAPGQIASGRVSSSLSGSLLHHSSFNPSALVSSTPRVTHQQLAQSDSTLSKSLELSVIPNTSKKTYLPPNTSTKQKSKVLSSASAASSGRRNSTMDQDMELLYCRLLQATYLDVKSAKALRLQKESTKNQMCTLWRAVEGRKDECKTLREELATAKRNAFLSSVLDIQAKELTPIISGLTKHQQHQQSLTVPQSLDVVHNQMATSGVLPQGKVESEIPQSESTISEILNTFNETHSNSSGSLPVSGSTEAAVNLLDREFQELEKCWKELSATVKLQVRGTSLEFEARQRRKQILPSLPTLQSLTV